MTNYGLPFNFKSVNTETGQEVMLKHDFYADYYWEGAGEKDKVYQSTGHHDANGTEVFFGDVLTTKKPTLLMQTWEVALKDNTVVIICKDVEFYADLNKSSEFVVLGNIHHSREELERRAQEVRV